MSFYRLPAKWRESVKEVEADGDHLDRDKHQDPQRVLERLQERHQLRRARLLKNKEVF